MQLRKIITYSTLGDNMKEIQSAATTLGELQPDLTRNNIRFEGMKLMTNPGQVTLESLQAELPEGEFQLFIMPQKVKSGYGANDDDLIDEEDGITWDEINWSLEVESPEDYTFKTIRDLTIARAKKAFSYLEKAIQYLANGNTRGTSGQSSKTASPDPILNSLREEAAKLQRNMEVFG